MSDPKSLDLGQLLADRRLRIQRPQRSALVEALAAAEADLQAADVVRESSPGWAEAILYEAALRSARVIVQASGYRIGNERGHVTAIDVADALTDGREHRRFSRLHRMRRMRHEFMYETAPAPSQQDLEQARRDAVALLELAREVLQRLG